MVLTPVFYERNSLYEKNAVMAFSESPIKYLINNQPDVFYFSSSFISAVCTPF